METYKSIMLLIKRFFKGTPKSEVNVNNIEVIKMENKYLRYQLATQTRLNKKLELKLKKESLVVKI